MFNDVLQTSKWKNIYDWLVMVLWLYINLDIDIYIYMTSWQSCIFGWMPYNIKYDFVVLSDDFDLLNRHTKNKTRRCWVYWPSVAPSQAAKWIWGFNFLNADSLRGVRGFLSHGGSPIFLFFKSSSYFSGIPPFMETHSPLVALSQTVPGDKTSRRLQADFFADSFKPLERFDCPGTVSLISFKNCQIIMDKYG